MEKKFLYFQPEYVNQFRCIGGECLNNCCDRSWVIDIDDATYKKYSQIQPEERAKEITAHFEYDDTQSKYMLKGRPCPFLTPDKRCGIQLEYGEDFLSVTCATYPRHTYNFGKFFERSLTLTCPVAAEMILFQEKPMAFEFVEVPEKIHSGGGKIQIGKVLASEDTVPLFLEMQIAMISILQARRFSIDQRLIILGLFLDKLQELLSAQADKQTLLNLIATYESEEFLSKEMSPLLQSFSGSAEIFSLMIMRFIGYTLPKLRAGDKKNFIGAFEETFGIEEKENVSAAPIIDKYKRLSDARKDFLEKYSTFLENYLVNELFMNQYPCRFANESITKNFAIFIISYKIFELIMFAATQKGFTSKADLLDMVDWFTEKMDHSKDLYDKFFELLKGIDDTFLLMTCLLKG